MAYKNAKQSLEYLEEPFVDMLDFLCSAYSSKTYLEHCRNWDGYSVNEKAGVISEHAMLTNIVVGADVGYSKGSALESIPGWTLLR